MKKAVNLKSIIQVLIFLSLGIALVVWKYKGLEAAEKAAMYESFKNIRWIWMIPIVIVGFFSHFFRALRWKQLLGTMDMHPSTTNITLSVLIGYLGNTVIPRFGEVAKCTILAKYEKLSVDKLVGSILAERAFDLVCLILIFVITLWSEFHTILPFANDLKVKFAGFIAELSLIWSLGSILLIIGFFVFLSKWLLPRIKNSKIGTFITGIGDGLKSIFHVKSVFLFIVNSLMIWVCYTTMAYIGFLAIPGLEDLSLMAALSVLAFGSIAMIITPGGIGAYPAIIASLLALYGVNQGLGLAYGWVSWSAQTIVVIIFGFASLILLPLVNKRSINDEKME